MSRAATTLAGYPFSQSANVLLSAMARTRGYTSNVWVSVPMVRMLQLQPKNLAHPPIQVQAANGACHYFHISQFTLGSAEIVRRWNAQYGHLNRGAASASAAEARATAPDIAWNTNGEPLPHSSQEQLRERLARSDSASAGSPYWATPEEADYIFRSPFDPAYLTDRANAIEVPSSFDNGKPLLYYNVSATARPEAFTAAACQRYDPVNYCDHLYAPMTSVRMKRFAIEYDCIQQRRWMSVGRVRRAGAYILPKVEPLSFLIGQELLLLVNIAATNRPQHLELNATEASDSDLIEEMLLVDALAAGAVNIAMPEDPRFVSSIAT